MQCLLIALFSDSRIVGDLFNFKGTQLFFNGKENFMKKIKRIAALTLLLGATMIMGTTTSADNNITVTYLPITDEFIRSETEKAILSMSESDSFSCDDMVLNKQTEAPSVTYLPVSEEFINAEMQKALDEYCASADEKEFAARGASIPTSIWNNSDGTYKGSGDTQYQPLYSAYSFMCGENRQLKIKGSMLVAEAQTDDLHIELINANDGTVTHVYIDPTDLNSGSYPFETGYYFNFNIGPLNKNHTYYLKFNTFSSVFNYFGHHVSYEVTAY